MTTVLPPPGCRPVTDQPSSALQSAVFSPASFLCACLLLQVVAVGELVSLPVVVLASFLVRLGAPVTEWGRGEISVYIVDVFVFCCSVTWSIDLSFILPVDLPVDLPIPSLSEVYTGAKKKRSSVRFSFKACSARIQFLLEAFFVRYTPLAVRRFRARQ